MKAYLIVLAGCLIANFAYSMEKNKNENKRMAILVLGDTKEYSVEKMFIDPRAAAYISALEYYQHYNDQINNQGYKNANVLPIKSKYFKKALYYVELIAKFSNVFE